MTDYQPLIARAIEGLGKSTGEARRALYERARSALVTQLRAVEPALSESGIPREGVDKSTGDPRRAVNERSRSALVTQLRAVEPALSESEITRERLSLEEAIRKVEADAARKSRMEARTEPRFEPRPLKPPGRPAPAAMP